MRINSRWITIERTQHNCTGAVGVHQFPQRSALSCPKDPIYVLQLGPGKVDNAFAVRSEGGVRRSGVRTERILLLGGFLDGFRKSMSSSLSHLKSNMLISGIYFTRRDTNCDIMKESCFLIKWLLKIIMILYF